MVFEGSTIEEPNILGKKRTTKRRGKSHSLFYFQVKKQSFHGRGGKINLFDVLSIKLCFVLVFEDVVLRCKDYFFSKK